MNDLSNNAKGKHGEVNTLLKNFLQYVVTNEPVDEFTEDVARQIVAVKNDPVARRDYMVLATRIKDAKREGFVEGEAKGRAEGEAKGRAEGEAKGRAEGEAQGELKERLKNVKAVMEKMEVNAYEAMNILEVPPEEQQKLLTLL